MTDAELYLERIEKLESKISRIEAHLGLSTDEEPGLPERAQSTNELDDSEELSFESKVGEIWFARVGSLILVLGLAFFISYPFPGFPAILVSFLGYLAVAALFALAQYWCKISPFLSRILFYGGVVLLYFATLRLHFFSNKPAITNEILGLILLASALAFSIYLAIRRQSQVLGGIILFLCYATALFSDIAHFTLACITISAAVSIYLLIKYNWGTAAILSLMMANLAHLLWLFNNPILGNRIQPIVFNHFNLAYLVVYGFLFGIANVNRKHEAYSELFEVFLTIFNSLGIFAIGGLTVILFHKSQLSLLAFLTFILFMVMAILNFNRTRSNYSAAYYVSFSHIALSTAIYVQFGYPDYFIYFGLQSFLVIITALWFHSRIIVLANILIYTGIFIAYLIFTPSHSLVNLSYAITALSSARILNWKKDRLELKTDHIRNVYLVCTFVIVLYGLYHAFPGIYVSISWLGAALFFFGLSVILKNLKYRYMALSAILATVIRIFIVDLSTLRAGARIILFIVAGIIILLLSLYYTQFQRKKYNQ